MMEQSDLTETMISDYSPYLKDPVDFRNRVMSRVTEWGPVVNIESVPFVDGSGIAEKIYTFKSGFEYSLDATRVGVKSL